MFHCNGWTFPWALAIVSGMNVCIRAIVAKDIFRHVADYGVTHMCGAPVVLNTIVDAPADMRAQHPFSQTIEFFVAAAPPPASVIQKATEFGIHVTHVYGLTEVYGPATICDWKTEWNAKPVAEQAVIKARQGVRYLALEGLMVAHPETMEQVPSDGKTMGEVMMRGNLMVIHTHTHTHTHHIDTHTHTHTHTHTYTHTHSHT
jgi:fatty-acyl-CoA synthase